MPVDLEYGDCSTSPTRTCVSRGQGDCYVAGTRSYPAYCGYRGLADREACKNFCLGMADCIGNSFATTCYLFFEGERKSSIDCLLTLQVVVRNQSLEAVLYMCVEETNW
jgi:hypothetical protein